MPITPECLCALAMLLGAVACGLFGVFLERTIVRRFYHRPIDSLVATWGISLIMTQGALLLLGSGAPGVGTPFGSVAFGGASFSIYRLVLVAVAVAVLVGLYLLFMKTRFGRHARATMQNAAWPAPSAFPSTAYTPSPSAWVPRSPASPAASMRRR